MAKKKILVTGANGQLGQELRLASGSRPEFDFLFTGRDQFPLGEMSATEINSFIKMEEPDYCINCAAYTAVDKAETEKETAFKVNGEAVGDLALACRRNSTRLLHISTDYVFDGQSSTPLKEGDPPGPINVYGASKLMGEQLAMSHHSQGTVIIRTSWVYSEFGNNFVRTMIRLMKEKPSINVINDQIGSPTYAADLATALFQIIDSAAFIPGIYHFSNEGRISWYEFALAIQALTHGLCKVNPISSAQYPTPARRPSFSLLDKSFIRQIYGIQILDWKDRLAACIQRLEPA